MKERKAYKGFLVLLITTLVGCGGGGDGGNESGGDPPPLPEVGATLDGTAAKGIIKFGDVVAEELDVSGRVIRQVGSTRTGADGRYSLTLESSYQGGPVQVTVTAGESTQMKCDVPAGCGTATDASLDENDNGNVDFGEWYKPGTLTMSALVAEAAAGDTLSVNITPFTNMAAARAKEGEVNAAAVYRANSEVSNLLGGIDILNTKPLDITDGAAIGDGSATEVAYAALSAAIAALADTSGGSPDIAGALATLSSSFSGGVIMADDGGSDPDTISLQEILDGASATLAQMGIGDTSGAMFAMQGEIGSAAGGSVDPEPSPSAGDTTLAKVKAFVADVRTWGTVIEAEMGSKGDAFGAQADLASTAAQSSLDLLMGPAFEAAIDASMQKVSGNPSEDLATYETGQPGDPQFTAGTITRSAGVVTISGGEINGVTVNMSQQWPDDLTTIAAGEDLTVGISYASFESTDTGVDINRGTITLTLASDYTIDYSALDNGTAAEPAVSGGGIDLDVSLTQRKGQDGLAVPVELDSPPVTFAGGLSATLVNPITDPVTGSIRWITPSSLTLVGNVSDGSNMLDARFTVNVSNAGTFEPVGELEVGTIHSGIISWSYSGETFTLVSPAYTIVVERDAVTGSATVTQTWEGIYTYSDLLYGGPFVDIVAAVEAFYFYSYRYFYPYFWIDGEGQYFVDVTGADFSVDGSVDGSLVDPEYVIEDAGNWLAGTAGLTFVLQLDGLPEASVTINGTRTDFEAGRATITIAYGSRRIVIEGEFAAATGTTPATATGSVTITNQDGIEMVVEGDFEALTGDVMFNGVSYATISQGSSGMMKITYNDGTFEIL